MPKSAKSGRRTLRIFISSPGDVQEERERARQVIESLRRRYARTLALHHIFWEDLPLQPGASFQQGIDAVLSDDAGIDVAVFVVWARLGSRVGAAILKPDGSEYLSGTEREFDLMMRARDQSAQSDRGAAPDILVYRRRDDASFDERLRGRPTGDQQELVRQKSLVEAFFLREFNDAASGVNVSAYHSYERPSLFSQRLRTHLVQLLDAVVGEGAQHTIWDIETQGAPFVGLESFAIRHADVFFGREEETLEARRALSEQARNGCAFLLLSGASGSGKSSLAQAGLAPDIIDNEIDEHVAVWRPLVVTPTELAPNLCAALVSRIASQDILPELAEQAPLADTADLFARHPVDACSVVLGPALSRASRNEKGAVRLLLIVDQLEELFASTSISDAERGKFLAALEALARCGGVWIVATVRADFYQHVQSEPALVRMKAGAGQLDILPPGPDALRRLVEEPAVHAGLRYERLEDGKSLSDLILRDAAAHPELLPLIEDFLRELYERREGDQLTLTAYEALGGSVEGSLAKRAEQVYLGLPSEAQSALGAVLQTLVTHGGEVDRALEDGAGVAAQYRVVRQWADLADFPGNTPARLLIDAFVRERLFTTGQHGETGAAGVTVAHESLLRVWPRAVDWAQNNADLLRTRASVVRRLKEGSPLLDGDPLLGAARDHLARNQGAFSPAIQRFIEDSVNAAEAARRDARLQKLRRQRWFALGATAAVVAIFVTIIGSFVYLSRAREQNALVGQFVAEAERGLSQRDYARAEIAAARALTIRDTPETRQLLVDARSGGVSFVASSADQPLAVALSAFSRDGELVVSTVEGQAILSVRSTSERRELWRIDLPVSGALDALALSDEVNGQRHLAVSWHEVDGAGVESFHVGLWMLAQRQPAGAYRELTPPDAAAAHVKRIPSLAFHPTMPWLATSGEDRALALWDYSLERPTLMWRREDAHDTAVHGIAFNRDGSLLGSGGGDYRVKIWRTADMIEAHQLGERYQDREPIAPVQTLRGHADSVFAVAFSPDGKLLASGGYDRIIRIWDLTLRNGQQQSPTIATLSGHEGTVLALSFSDDSRLLTSGGADESVRLWDVSEGRLLVTTTPGNGVVRSVATIGFEDDLHIGGENGWSIWSLRGRSVAARLWNGGATVQAIAFDPTGDLLAAGGDDGQVRVWNRAFTSPVVLTATAPDPALQESINGIVFSADSRWVAAGGEGHVIHVWDRSQAWRRVAAPGGALQHDGSIWGLCFDPLSRWLASTNTDTNKRIRRWRMSDWSLLDQSESLTDTVYSLACDTSGQRIVSGDSRARVAVRETEHLAVTAETRNVRQGEVNVWSVAIADAPLSILSGNSDGRVYRWIPADAAWTGAAEERKDWTSDEDARVNRTINSVSYSRTHGWIAAGGTGSSVEIYDQALRRIRSLRGHDGTIWWVAFDAAGSRLAYGGTDRILRVFDLDEMARNLETDTPAELYAESREMTGLVAEVRDGRIAIARANARPRGDRP
jgi:WD40 repeat protein